MEEAGRGCSGVEYQVGWVEFKGMKSGGDVGVVVWSLILFVIFVCRMNFVCSGLSYIPEFSFVWDLWHCLLVRESWDCIIGKLVRSWRCLRASGNQGGM